jgi:hypothetical protein
MSGESRVIRNPAARGVPRNAPPGDTRENVSVASFAFPELAIWRDWHRRLTHL